MPDHRFTPQNQRLEPDGAESLDAWGFRDSAFTALPNGNVLLTGTRYPPSGLELPYLLPWIRKVMEIELPVDDLHPTSYPPEVPASRDNLPFQNEIRELLPDDAVSDDPLIRLRHGHGHTLEEMDAIRHGRLASRAPPPE